MTADSRIGPDGYQYGVRFHDGSVGARWNGRTQREQALSYLRWLRERYPRDANGYALVRRSAMDAEWEEPER